VNATVYRGLGVCAVVLLSATAIAQRNGQPASDQLGQEDIWGNYTDSSERATELFLLNRGGAGGASLRFFSRDGEEMAVRLR